MNTEQIPARLIPPGEILKFELEARGWDQKDLAEIIKRPEQVISEIINGKKGITPETAIQLGHAFGTSAEFWFNLDRNYRLWEARKAEKSGSITIRSQLYSLAPVAELKKIGWIPKTNDVETLKKSIFDLLEINSFNEMPSCHVNLRCFNPGGLNQNSQIAWLKRVEYLVRDQKVKNFNPSAMDDCIHRLLELSACVEDTVKIPGVLFKYGIKFAIVPHLQKTHIDGASFWVNGTPVVALTQRFDRVDYFWFTLMHEIAHIKLGHKAGQLDTLFAANQAPGIIGKQELEANKLAQNWLVDPKAYSRFLTASKPPFSKKEIISLASAMRRHPGIIVGRLQYDGLVNWGSFRGFLAKVSPYTHDLVDRPIAA